MIDFTHLSEAKAIWDYWRFEPWAKEDMKGLYRRVTFSKGGFFGEVARYFADDYIVFSYGESSLEWVRQNWTYEKDVMIHRFVFLSPKAFEKRVKAFAWGFRGYLETYLYAPMGRKYVKIKDLTPLIDKAWEATQDRVSGGDKALGRNSFDLK